MASKQSTVDFLVEQVSQAGIIRARKMFGEYGLYCDEKLVGLVCDDQLFLKPTEAGRAYSGDFVFVEKPPYPGAKPYLLVAPDLWDEREWLAGLVRATATELPLPKPKLNSKSKAKPKKSDKS